MSSRRSPRMPVRIARYLYLRAYLSGASAVLVGPTRDGRLYLSGPRVRQRFLEAFRIRSEHAASIDAAMREAIVARLY